jgi:hypothetical protein
MRDHGVDMPDPRFDANGGMTMQIGGGGQQPDPDAMQAAQEACQDLMGPAPGDGDTAERGPSSDTEGQPEASEVIP